jgi:hypothetical protein
MNAADFAPAADGATSFLWAIEQMGTNTRVTAGQTSTTTGHLAHLYRELLDHAVQVEAERDRWVRIATKLGGVSA